MRSEPLKFENEAALCEAFLQTIPEGWTPYNETAGWDILLVHSTGFQIGVEAKQRLNAKCLVQAMDAIRGGWTGPDCRAVLVGAAGPDLCSIARRLGITVITMEKRRRNVLYGSANVGGDFISMPDLPTEVNLERLNVNWNWLSQRDWFDHAPTAREPLPEFVPNVPAGCPSPTILSQWKIQALKMVIWVERNRYATRAHFKHLNISPSMWMNGNWMKPTGTRGVWEAGRNWPGERFKAEHPQIVPQIEEKYSEWSSGMEHASTQIGRLI